MKKFIMILVIVCSTLLTSQPFYNYKVLNANNITIRLNNYGSLELPKGNAGGIWNQIPNLNTIVYDQGIWIIGKLNNFPHMASVNWIIIPHSSFSPGPIINGQAGILTNPLDSLNYRVYKISKGDNLLNPDFEDWPADLGAPVDLFGNPLVYGDQTLWTVYNGFDSTSLYRQRWNQYLDTLPIMPVEVHQIVYAREGNTADSIDIFSNTVFFEWTVINKGKDNIDSCYLSLWTDIDFSDSFYNFPAVDTNYQIGYCWSNKGEPEKIPTVGYVLLYGPKVNAPGDTAFFKGRKTPNTKNLGLSSFHYIIDDAIPAPPGDPAHSLTGAWNIARGFETNGQRTIDPVTKLQTKFPLSGDPVTNSGWIYKERTGGGAGFNLFTGPFNLAVNDTQWIMIALIPALGKDGYESISIMREKAKLLKSIPYDSLAFGLKRKKEQKLIPIEYKLDQNYPNPFNSISVIRWQLPVNSYVVLKVCDVLGKEVVTLVNEEKSAGNHEVIFKGENMASGVYIYTIKAGDFYKSKKLVLIK